MLHSLRLRYHIGKAKLAGDIPQLPWLQLGSLFVQSTTSWPWDLFATPLREDTDGTAEFSTPLGNFWAPVQERDALSGTVLEMLGHVYEHGPVKVRPGDVVFDLGANLGTFTRVALKHGASRVIAFEANPVMIRVLRKTYAPELAAGALTIVESPVWSKEAVVCFSGDSLTGHISDTGTALKATTIDKTVADLNLTRVDFMKADIEGAERHALMGARDTLARYAPKIAFCVYHYADDPEVIVRLVTSSRSYHTQFEGSGRFVYCW